jgi:hypothetical protein
MIISDMKMEVVFNRQYFGDCLCLDDERLRQRGSV